MQAGAVARSMATELAGYPAVLAKPDDVDTAELVKLTALGYLGGAVVATGPLPHPRGSIHVLQDAKAPFRLAAEGHDGQAGAGVRGVPARVPGFFGARYAQAQTPGPRGRLPVAPEG